MYIKIHHNREGAVATESTRERECVHLLYAIVVTAPVFQLDTSELNPDAPQNTARKRRVQQRKERPHPPRNQQKRFRFKPQTKQKKKTCETCDPTNLELSYMYMYTFNNTLHRKAPCGHRERECVREYTYSKTYLSPPQYPTSTSSY